MEEASEDKELPQDEEKNSDSDRIIENEINQKIEDSEALSPKVDEENQKGGEGTGDGDEKIPVDKKDDTETQPEDTKDETTVQTEVKQDDTKIQTEASKDTTEAKKDDTDLDDQTKTDVKKEEADKTEGDDIEEVATGEAAVRETTTRRKKKGSKTRKVDMNIYYPDELSASAEETTTGRIGEKVEVRTGAKVAHSDDSMIYSPLGDYSVRDPSFLDEFFTSEEVLVKAAKAHSISEEVFGELKTEVEEEEEFQQEIYIQPPDKEVSDMIYDQICDLETPISTDESFTVPRFRYIQRRKRWKGLYDQQGEMAGSQSTHSLEAASTSALKGMKYLMELVIPSLKKALTEVALYQPQNPVRYMTYSLLHQSKTPAELDMDPDPHLIQALVDGQKKKKKVGSKKPEVFIEPFAESHDALPTVDVPSPVHSPREEDPSHIGRFQQKYKSAKQKLLKDEKDMRSNVSRRDMLPGICLGPTSLPLPPDPVAPSPAT